MELIDLKGELKKLLDQVPENMVTTPSALAYALGDLKSERAVKELLKNMDGLFGKVSMFDNPETEFKEFVSRYPLRQLANLQKAISKNVEEEDNFESSRLIAGVDASYYDGRAYGVCVVMDQGTNFLKSASDTINVCFPYIPGYLAFREGPVAKIVVEMVKGFDILLVNGHGVAHPRGCGFASQLGVELNITTIGIAKRLFVGEPYEKSEKYTSIHFNDKVIGAKLDIDGRAPIFVSVGHKISLETAVEVVRNLMSTRTILPEPLMRAHHLSQIY